MERQEDEWDNEETLSWLTKSLLLSSLWGVQHQYFPSQCSLGTGTMWEAYGIEISDSTHHRDSDIAGLTPSNFRSSFPNILHIINK